MNRRPTNGRSIIPLLVRDPLRRNIRSVASKVGLTQAEVMRLSMRRGLPLLERALGRAK